MHIDIAPLRYIVAYLAAALSLNTEPISKIVVSTNDFDIKIWEMGLGCKILKLSFKANQLIRSEMMEKAGTVSH